MKNNAEGPTEQPTGDDQRPSVECEQPTGDGEPLARENDKPDGDAKPDESKRCDEESLYQSLWVDDVKM